MRKPRLTIDESCTVEVNGKEGPGIKVKMKEEKPKNYVKLEAKVDEII